MLNSIILAPLLTVSGAYAIPLFPLLVRLKIESRKIESRMSLLLWMSENYCIICFFFLWLLCVCGVVYFVLSIICCVCRSTFSPWTRVSVLSCWYVMLYAKQWVISKYASLSLYNGPLKSTPPWCDKFRNLDSRGPRPSQGLQDKSFAVCSYPTYHMYSKPVVIMLKQNYNFSEIKMQPFLLLHHLSSRSYWDRAIIFILLYH